MARLMGKLIFKKIMGLGAGRCLDTKRKFQGDNGRSPVTSAQPRSVTCLCF